MATLASQLSDSSCDEPSISSMRAAGGNSVVGEALGVGVSSDTGVRVGVGVWLGVAVIVEVGEKVIVGVGVIVMVVVAVLGGSVGESV